MPQATKIAVILTSAFFVPAVAHAENINQFLSDIVSLIDNALIPLLLAVAFITFIYGVFKYFIAGSTSREERQQGRTMVMYSLIGFFILLSAWGIINLLVYQFQDTLPSEGEPIYVPEAPV